MTDEAKALVEQFVKRHRSQNPFRTADVHQDDCTCLRCAVDLLDFSGQRIAELEAALKSIEAGTYPRPLGKPWRMDLSSSKHDRCVHDVWMYETCDGCLDAFVRAALGDTQ